MNPLICKGFNLLETTKEDTNTDADDITTSTSTSPSPTPSTSTSPIQTDRTNTPSPTFKEDDYAGRNAIDLKRRNTNIDTQNNDMDVSALETFTKKSSLSNKVKHSIHKSKSAIFLKKKS